MNKNAENLINNCLKFSLQQSYHYGKVNFKSIIIWRRNKNLIITHRQSQHIKCRYRLYMSWDIQPPGIPPIWFALLKFAMKSTPLRSGYTCTLHRCHKETELRLSWCWGCAECWGVASRRQDVGVACSWRQHRRTLTHVLPFRQMVLRDL